ncbi:hypothetical protein NQ318_021829, partial [Aromia moschata]
EVGLPVRSPVHRREALGKIGSVFSNLYKDGLLTDCILHCKDGTVRAHKLILAASSPYFRKVFLEHHEKQAIFVMYGVSVGLLKELLELIYQGSTEVPGETLRSVLDLAEELQVTGILAASGSTESQSNGCGRDTRFKGQKRVAVDFAAPEENEATPAKITKNISESTSNCHPRKEAITRGSEKHENVSQNDDHSDASNDANTNIVVPEIETNERLIGHSTDEQSSLSVWARKERKFKCDLCPSSFKRASHLSRHQLVHTGERPFACNQCDKAFSRHDKLKHHIQKAHEINVLNESLPSDSLYTIGQVQILSPEQTMIISPEPLEQNIQTVPQKKGRGRPRKHPIAPPPLVKRPRGRPRLYPIAPKSVVKRPRGRPRLNPVEKQETPAKIENYDMSNIPYTDYSTNPNDEITIHDHIMEPLVEIKTEPSEKPDLGNSEGATFLENIGLFENSAIAKIGECTISVANNSNNSP